MSMRETFSNSIDLAVINECDKEALIRFQQCFGTFTILLVEASFERGIFRHLSDYVFQVRNFENTKPMRVIFLYKIFRI